MGQTLSSAAQWTTAKEGGRGKLEYTPANEAILNKIISFVDGFSSEHSEESKVVFKRPLVWTSELNMSEFSSGGYARRDDNQDEVVSEAVDKRGRPLLVMKRRGARAELAVSSFNQLETVLRRAGDKKMAEARLCLEANSDPIAAILGDRFATVSGSDSSAYRFVEEILSARGTRKQGGVVNEEEEGRGRREEDGDTDGEEGGEDVKAKKLSLKLLLLLRDFDDKLMQDAVKTIATEVKLSPPDVDRAVDLLKKFSGDDKECHVLKDIDWIEPHVVVFSNGCRAPFWRQLNGDISYIVVRSHGETAPVYITASTNGYFINGGPNNESGDLDFENQGGQFYKDLVTLLREKDSHFSAMIDKKDVFKTIEKSPKKTSKYTSSNDQMNNQRDRDDVDGQSQRSNYDDQSRTEKKKQEQKRKLEPSLKWKILEVEEKEKKEEKQVTIKATSATIKKKSAESHRMGLHSDGDSSFEESPSESDDDEESMDRRNDATADLPSEYWQIQKLVKYLKGGNQTATIIALCSMRDFNLAQETCQLAIRDVGGLEVLINLLDTDEPKCKIGSLKILKEISKNAYIRRAIADLGGLQIMVRILQDPNKELKCLAAETIANVAKFRRSRRAVRQHGGIKNLVALLAYPNVEVARCGALALWSCSKSERNKQAMRKAGAIPLLARLLKPRNSDSNMLIPVVGTLQECANEPNYRLAIRMEGMIEDLVRHLKSDNAELQMHCASAIFKCAEEKKTRDLIRQYGGLDPLVTLITKTENKDLLAAATGAIWKCAISPENVARFQELKAIDLLVGLLNNQPEEVLVNVVGALAELAKDPPNRLTIRKANGIPQLVNLLTGTNRALLVNVTKAVGHCAEEPDNMAVIDKLDGVRLLWSLLKNQNQDVQASAAWAICPCIENTKDAGEMVRSFVGGLELIVSLLRSNNDEVLASVCAAIANIANDEENLAVITDHGVVPMLAKLAPTTEDRLRRHLAEAIARCCNWGNNRVVFGREDAVRHLVMYLKSTDPDVHRSTAKALHQLSKDPDNCITMHDTGVVKPLLELISSDDHILQEAAAGCLSNIRRLAMANEKSRKH